MGYKIYLPIVLWFPLEIKNHLVHGKFLNYLREQEEKKYFCSVYSLMFASHLSCDFGEKTKKKIKKFKLRQCKVVSLCSIRHLNKPD